jgi:transposase InsO family protein
MRSKDQAKTKVMEHIEWLEQQHGFKAKWIRVDEGREYLSEKLKPALTAKGIEIRQTAPYSQSQNGVSERVNHTLVEFAGREEFTQKFMGIRRKSSRLYPKSITDKGTTRR